MLSAVLCTCLQKFVFITCKLLC